ncbi:hypothetical protein KVR01_007444 [Diaporthe batatas]|uniref:uncharacterized protein n=1 Tax=Diaporthe batatas TaxID=748121 RepID=UPI001D03B8F6|nr:uncharacterized protein KVR01_007444 [Diaporthe batatas]KAG8162966.1 hypothetical protein KVR01_007444 [Diaporthe batatas]
MASVRRAPYKDFLQPALHRRFTSTATLLLAIAFVEAVVLARWDSPFWAVFPVGPTGIRAFFIFLCGLAILVLRIAQYHIGLRTSNSGLQTFFRYAVTPQTLEAIVSYTLSAWLFSQIYLWSATEDLAWVSIQPGVGGRVRLNEKPIFFTVHFLVLGVVHGALHISRDEDRLRLNAARLKAKDAAPAEAPRPWSKRLMSEVPLLAHRALVQTLSVLVFNIFFYHAVLRSLAWRVALIIFRPFYTMPKTNLAPTTHGGMSFPLWVKCSGASFMLLFLWLAGNRMFSMFLVRPPLKNGNPLTSESKDQNGSLLNGLKSKKLPIKCFATWELALIARDFQPRRHAIYQDIDRADGPMWSQVYALCLQVVKDMESRIDGHNQAAAAAREAAAKANSNAQAVVQTPTKTFRAEMGDMLQKKVVEPGQPSRLSPLVKKGVAHAKDYVDDIARQATGTDAADNPYKHWTRLILDSPLGQPFKQGFSRRITTVVLGEPYGEPALVINAVSALTRLAVSSLAEDSYGNVQRDVSTIIRTFTSVKTKLEAFKADFPLHWTDQDAARECAEVEAILETLKEGLVQLIVAFGPYARDLRLTFADVRQAREAAGLPAREGAAPTRAEGRPEMRQVR